MKEKYYSIYLTKVNFSEKKKIMVSKQKMQKSQLKRMNLTCHFVIYISIILLYRKL